MMTACDLSAIAKPWEIQSKVWHYFCIMQFRSAGQIQQLLHEKAAAAQIYPSCQAIHCNEVQILFIWYCNKWFIPCYYESTAWLMIMDDRLKYITKL